MYKEKKKILEKRAYTVYCCIFLIFIFLIFRLFFLQVLNQKRYKLLSDKNRIYTSFSVAPRGIIYDRNNNILALSTYKYQAAIDLNQYIKNETRWKHIKKELNIDPDMVFKDIVDLQIKKKGPSRLIVIKKDLSWKDILRTEILSSKIPGIFTKKKIIRNYPFAETFCHVIGYVTAPKIEDISNDASLNILDSTIGQAGIEQEKEFNLRGEIGVKYQEINAFRRFIRVIEERKAKIGKSIQTTLDASLQAETIKIMGQVRKGAAIVINIKTGDILVMVSIPTFNPSLFSNQMTNEQWKAINSNPDNPLINRAISGLYAPGSTFKMVVALAALKAGIINKHTTFYCPGYNDVNGRRFHCWKWRVGGHGTINIRQAISQSCDVFFYCVAEKLGALRILEAAKNLGVGIKKNFGFKSEKSGFLPSASQTTGKSNIGQALNISIGQGKLLMTPLQMVTMVASIASGKLVIPQIIASSDKPSFNELPFSKEQLEIVQQGMRQVVSEGTAWHINNNELEISGKTGSTQIVSITNEERKQHKLNERPYHLRDHALFVGYAPTNDPTFAVVVVVEHGESGGRIAAPLAKEILLAAKRLVK
ncbi:MAG: penicillin-binding protein 2 [Holosporales bacterium]|nr:penicillin-binding protein 2 [Holosporales bacterium]